MEDFIQELEESLYKGFIDQDTYKDGKYNPELLVNNATENKNVLSSLTEELGQCRSFIFSVAFITESGLAALKSHLYDLKKKGIHGRILTSTFLNFNQPKVFKELQKITNVEVRLSTLEGFHSKGYIFEHNQYFSLIVGSSNLTAQALKVNYEWNIKLTSYENGEVINHFKNQFEEAWENAKLLTNQWVYEYEKNYRPPDYAKSEKVIELPGEYGENPVETALQITPNKMQQEALKQIQAVREEEKERALVVSATGTGKTYLSAFDVRRFAPKRMLFIVHREQILQKAKADYQKVLGGRDDEFGILSGSRKELDAQYLFTTIQTLSKESVLHDFDEEEFDYILIDEVHKAGASSYQKVIDYFKPQFMLGMTATPERTDDFNIFGLFHYNIAYEIRLQEALEEDMLCPFHYFGVTDFEYSGELIDDTAMLSRLVTDERVEHIIEKIHYYGYSGERVRGLMFCSRKEEAVKLSDALNKRGYRTVALTGGDSQEERIHQVTRLENGVLDYILTVDIFNEGIDIPSINQVVMLRQTESSIIFIQQLGRGLRRHESKDFVTIIDFIGNYKNNYMIPIALSGDRSQNKDNIRRHMVETNYIKGVSTINFEEVAKQQIFESINASKLTAMKVFRDAYTELRHRIGRMPYLYDFLVNHSLDPVMIANKFQTHFGYLAKMEKDIPIISSYENKVLTMISLELLNGKRRHELILMDLLLREGTVASKEYEEALETAGCIINETIINSVKRIFNLTFFTETDRRKYGEQPIILQTEGGMYTFTKVMQNSLKSNEFFRRLVQDAVKSGLKRSARYQPEELLTRYEKYTRKDACRLLNWNKDESATMFGYKTKHQTTPIFITYHKNDEVEDSIDYGDEFISPDVMKWESRNNRRLTSSEIQKIINPTENDMEVHLFVKKSDDEDGSDFYYLGKAQPDIETVREDSMPNSKGKIVPVVHMNMLLEQPVENSLYNYIIQENS